MAEKTSRVPASLRVIGRSIVDWWDGWLDMVLVMIIWLVAQVTVILGPPATFGVYYVVHNMVNGEALGVRGLISGARKYFWKSLLWGLINLMVLVTLYVNYSFYGSIKAGWGPYVQIVIVMFAYLWVCTQFYGLPYFMELEVKKLRIALKNGILTTLAAPFYTFALMLFGVLVVGLSVGFIIPLFLGLPGLIPFMGFRAMHERLIAFGLREREKTPREIEMEESSRVNAPKLNRAGDDASAGGVTDGEG